ncbi:hypothetical protein Glove_40g69 [Diversispora epigaea]|uniref:Cas12f1-like TNB domain-containing protein n=1 Tax=Diversispora epigaea TaxID=1348612 RepID=A0A397JFF7_9GLOM|nr:hypothetical protein Glove_40g69 [Diversispora epigaea]
MCTSHYRFQQHLINKACKHPWCQIVVCTEEYTSKTCGSCDYIHEKLGGSKEFCCPQCKAKIDRDINGTRDIFLKYLTKKESAWRGCLFSTGLHQKQNFGIASLVPYATLRTIRPQVPHCVKYYNN